MAQQNSVQRQASNVSPQPISIASSTTSSDIQPNKPTVYTISDLSDDGRVVLNAEPKYPRLPKDTNTIAPIPQVRPSSGQPIHIPSNGYLFRDHYANRVDQLDRFQTLNTQKTSAETEKDLQDLLQQSFDGKEDEQSANDDIDMSKAVVEGFREGIRLLPHQVVGRTWMAEWESGKKHGGILADDMGLGKTIQTLTRIVDGRPRKSDIEEGWAATTLVVCPVSLVSQWASEISKMAKKLTVVEYHGASRSTNPETLTRAHVVVTSYAIVASEYAASQPEAKDKSKAKTSNSKKAESHPESDSSSEADHFGRMLASKKKASAPKGKKKDALFNTKAAQACSTLDGKNWWCLIGTPLQNNVEELYSLLKFLRIKPLNEWQTFNEQISKPLKSGRSAVAMKRLHVPLKVVLRAIMLRRHKNRSEASVTIS
ncbi:P-loop containing nucleoside triphosphate hydrolase protein [Lactarius quietus]|nr:P-loop containing nucleoside triphosphate hydrolase protein [Lactarius quietus]